MAVSVVVADAHPLIRCSVQLLLGGVDDLAVVAVCSDLFSLVRAVADHGPDVVVTAVRLSPGDREAGIVFAEQMRRSHPSMGVVVLSGATNPEYACRVVGSQAAGRGFLLKERLAERNSLVDAIRLVASGGSIIDPAVDVLPCGAVLDQSVRCASSSREGELALPASA